MLKRRFTSTPAWVDYTYQIVEWIDNTASTIVSRATSWMYGFLDKHCHCSRCEDRRKRGLQ